ncbi:MAG: HAMP domain-containing histidine kinase [Planctomycetaceae bacterium]|jgi:signal transduction histidine kinase|nr:HAMP domain-containing histidine kinase [Planctomycetaceae bacterium]
MIRDKFLVSLGILILLVAVLAGAGLYAVYLYQKQVRDIAWQVNVLPLAHKIAGQSAEIHVGFGELRSIPRTQLRLSPLPADNYRTVLEDRLQKTFTAVKQSCQEYRQVLDDRIMQNDTEASFAKEIETLQHICLTVQDLETAVSQPDWSTTESNLDAAGAGLTTLQKDADSLPVFLNQELQGYSQTIKRHAVWLKGFVLFYLTVSMALMFFLVYLSYWGIFHPLQILVNGARLIAAGHGTQQCRGYRITVRSKGEIAELADVMNLITQRFQEKVEQLEESKRDLDAKVQERSKELVRSERLAGVGFLAAGVAHEINNPLMVITAAAETLQRRIGGSDADTEFVCKYLKMIQDESFRCKKITEQLLSIARNEPKEKTLIDIVTIITDMAELVRQQSAFKQKNVILNLPERLEVKVHPQEMKQVVLNLLTNAFQNTLPAGTVMVTLCRYDDSVILTVQDDGFGMDSEVLQNIFEPFYTQSRHGGGTGLGLSITHRIIEEHNGRIEAFSGGINQGAKFVVELRDSTLQPCNSVPEQNPIK